MTARAAVPPFVIFAMARCGSTTLMRALNTYPDVNCLMEPFTPANKGRTYLGITTPAGLHDALTRIRRTHNGFKHIWHPDGWPFPGAPRLNHRLLADEGLRIIFLNRRNELRRVVSAEMSKQTAVWSTFTEEQRDRAREFDFAPVPAAKVGHELAVGAAGLAELRASLPEDPTLVLELWYEDLLAEQLDLPARMAVLARIHAFLAGDNAAETDPPAAAGEPLDPLRWRLNSEHTYRLLPNLDELERLHGCDTTGWLLEDNHNTAEHGSPAWDTRSGTST